jgi:hypothetical protein
VPPAIAPYKATIDQYCIGCHNQRTKTAGLALEGLDLTKLPEHADIWEKAIMKVRGHLMPPPNARQPDAAAAQALVAWLENSLDQAAATDGMTLVVTRVYIKHRKIKFEVGVAKGKKLYDKRETELRRIVDRETRAQLKQRNR